MRAERKSRRLLGWLPYLIMGSVGVVAVILTLAFSNSWWVQRNPRASAQQEYDGQSMFTQAGTDYSGRTGHVVISLARDRPSAARLGLDASGSRTVSYIVAVDVKLSAGETPLRIAPTDQFRVDTVAGRVGDVTFLDHSSYNGMLQHSLELLGSMGGTKVADDFDAQLDASRAASADKAYDAVETATKNGIRVRVELKGTPSSAESTIVYSPATA